MNKEKRRGGGREERRMERLDDSQDRRAEIGRLEYRTRVKEQARE